MRIVFSVILSLALSVAVCLILAAAGLLKFRDDGVVAGLKPMSEKVISRVATALDALPTVSEDTSPSVSQETSLSPWPAGQASSVPATIPVPNTPATADRKTLVHTRALVFLSAKAGKDGAEIEDRFAEFLLQELNLDQQETARLVRMSFWKNFVTVQQQWVAGQRDEMRLAFAREKDLKQAGFAAKGLALMANEVQEAEACLEELSQRLSEGAREGEKL